MAVNSRGLDLMTSTNHPHSYRHNNNNDEKNMSLKATLFASHTKSHGVLSGEIVQLP